MRISSPPSLLIRPDSSSLVSQGITGKAMSSADSKNVTALNPGGLQAQPEHTEIENELHEKAHIDYDRVSIIANPSVAALYEDALVYGLSCAVLSIAHANFLQRSALPSHPPELYPPILDRKLVVRLQTSVSSRSLALKMRSGGDLSTSP
jgi:hypothetical protein